MILKFCRLWKKPLVDPHQKKMNCLFSLEESINHGSRGKGSLETPKEQGIRMKHPMDT